MDIEITASKSIIFPTSEYLWMCTDYKSPIHYQGILYPSVRHAILSLKTDDIVLKRKITETLLPANLKDLEREITPSNLWSKELATMLLSSFTFEKFVTHPELGKKLLNTGKCTIEHVQHILGTSLANFEIDEINIQNNSIGSVLMITRELIRLL